MVAAPGLMPLTLPLPSTEATDASLLLHTPPVAVALSVMPAPTHTAVGPLMVPATGAGATVTPSVVNALAQPVVTVYVIVAVPEVRGVAMPAPLIVATEVLLLLHTPPGEVDV